MINFFSSKTNKNKSSEWEIKGSPKDFTLDTCSSIGILFDATNADSVILFNNLINAIKHFEFSINALCEGYNQDIELCKKMALSQYTSKDFSLLKGPKTEVIKNFTSKKNDIFIDISLNSKKNTIRIRKSANATLKVGINIQEDTFDFCFTIIKKDEQSYQRAFEQMMEYIGKINK